MSTTTSRFDLSAAYEALAQRRAETVSLVRAKLAEAPESFEAWHLLGLAHLNRTEPSHAIQVLVRAAGLAPSAYYIFHNLGLAFLQEGQADPALGCFLRSVELEPENVQALVQIAQLLHNLGLSAAGPWTIGRCLSVIAAISPATADGHRARTYFARARGDLQLAELSLRRCSALTPADPAVERDLVEILRLRGRPRAALDVLRRISAAGREIPSESKSWLGWLQAMSDGRLSLDGHIDIALALDGPVIAHRHRGTGPRPRLFISYIRDALPLSPDDPWFDGHANRWESAEINRLLLRLGFDLDVADSGVLPAAGVDYAGFLAGEGAPWRGARQARTVKLRLATGSSPDYQNRRERARVQALAARTGATYRLYRQIADEVGELASLAEADAIALIGNAHTLSTYAGSLHAKTMLIPVSASPPAPAEGPGPRRSGLRHFLWYAGAGAILKGLDLVLEAFAGQEHLTLELVGPATEEPELRSIYGRLLSGHPRFLVHGPLSPRSPAFAAVLDRCIAFVAPSASEGMSGSVVACLQAGLYPIISRDCGVDLPPGLGQLIDEPTVETLSRKIAEVAAMPADLLLEQTAAIRRWALDGYSRERFSRAMERFLRDRLSHLLTPSA